MNQKKKFYMTPAGFEKLANEQKHLLYSERPAVTKVVTWAAGNGDRSENADYLYGKKRLREIDKRLRFLGNRIENAQIVDPEKVTSNQIQFGATVKVENDQGEEKTYSIVGIDEIAPDRGLVSYQSPIGRALLGKRVGDTVELTTPKGEIELEVLEVMYCKIKEKK